MLRLGLRATSLTGAGRYRLTKLAAFGRLTSPARIAGPVRPVRQVGPVRPARPGDGHCPGGARPGPREQGLQHHEGPVPGERLGARPPLTWLPAGRAPGP